ncbi:unnamed protein product [Paramecium sonneborni]|uniref:Uncharacterized protein n=1 Tax=Paramecium sonneborni TaxID=65129 RepID=A0A8S1QBG0_9CILI|nr:unnamed protein product [Paramecium sonneborni]
MGKNKEQQTITNKDINDIFKSIQKQNNIKKNKSEQSQNKSTNQDQKIVKSQNTQPVQNNKILPKKTKHTNIQQQSKPKYTEEGYKVYNTDELKIGKGGNTDKCPFDCECCF